uniref:Snakin-2 n=1 Tax=Anthurium amnicola TaxID=1678845 RepID=A0A1D1XY22_9ARAE
MGFYRASMVCILLLMALLAAQTAESRPAAVDARNGRSLLATIDCSSACATRCQLSSRPNLCMRACGTCCHRCNCVPPGTSGNKEVCPCYARMTTHGGKPKCP